MFGICLHKWEPIGEVAFLQDSPLEPDRQVVLCICAKCDKQEFRSAYVDGEFSVVDIWNYMDACVEYEEVK